MSSRGRLYRWIGCKDRRPCLYPCRHNWLRSLASLRSWGKVGCRYPAPRSCTNRITSSPNRISFTIQLTPVSTPWNVLTEKYPSHYTRDSVFLLSLSVLVSLSFSFFSISFLFFSFLVIHTQVTGTINSLWWWSSSFYHETSRSLFVLYLFKKQKNTNIKQRKITTKENQFKETDRKIKRWHGSGQKEDKKRTKQTHIFTHQ